MRKTAKNSNREEYREACKHYGKFTVPSPNGGKFCYARYIPCRDSNFNARCPRIRRYDRIHKND